MAIFFFGNQPPLPTPCLIHQPILVPFINRNSDILNLIPATLTKRESLR